MKPSELSQDPGWKKIKAFSLSREILSSHPFQINKFLWNFSQSKKRDNISKKIWKINFIISHTSLPLQVLKSHWISFSELRKSWSKPAGLFFIEEVEKDIFRGGENNCHPFKNPSKPLRCVEKNKLIIFSWFSFSHFSLIFFYQFFFNDKKKVRSNLEVNISIVFFFMS